MSLSGPALTILNDQRQYDRLKHAARATDEYGIRSLRFFNVAAQGVDPRKTKFILRVAAELAEYCDADWLRENTEGE